jgi:hypothetical protein
MKTIKRSGNNALKCSEKPNKIPGLGNWTKK